MWPFDAVATPICRFSPINSPRLFTNGPPESPLVRAQDDVMADASTARISPNRTTGLFPSASRAGNPAARTTSPTMLFSPVESGTKLLSASVNDSTLIDNNATSADSSTMIRCASYDRPLGKMAVTAASAFNPCATVRTRPLLETTTPEDTSEPLRIRTVALCRFRQITLTRCCTVGSCS